MQFQFRPRWIPSIAAAAAAALTFYLGMWQTGRAQEKLHLQAAFEEQASKAPLALTAGDRDGAALRYRRVLVSGEYLPEKQLFLDNKHHNGVVGFHVVTPLRLVGSNVAVLVNRGWVARSRDYPRTPDRIAPAGMVEVPGVAVLPIQRFVELSDAPLQGNVWQNLTIERARTLLGLDVLPVIVLAETATPDLVPVTEVPNAGVDMHRGYAVQWFLLAGLVAFLWIILNLKRVGK